MIILDKPKFYHYNVVDSTINTSLNLLDTNLLNTSNKCVVDSTINTSLNLLDANSLDTNLLNTSDKCVVDSTINTSLNLLDANSLDTNLLNTSNKCVVVTADWQSAGRGRNGKIWESEQAANLLFTFAFVHSVVEVPLYLLQVVGSLATYELIASYVKKSNIKLKYPNDVYVKSNSNCRSCKRNYKKIAGIISETNYISDKIVHSAIGIGVNISKIPNEESVPNAIALSSCIEDNKKLDLDFAVLTSCLANNIRKNLAKTELAIKKEWQNLLNILGKKIIVQNETEKIYYAVSILDDCRLQLKDNLGNIKNIDDGDSIRYDLE